MDLKEVKALTAELEAQPQQKANNVAALLKRLDVDSDSIVVECIRGARVYFLGALERKDLDPTWKVGRRRRRAYFPPHLDRPMLALLVH